MMKFEPQCKKQSDLYREWARVLDMCEGVGVNPTLCVRFGIVMFNSSEDVVRGFIACDRLYCVEFAIAIVEGKPVFRGDVLFNNYLDKTVTILGRLADVHGRDCLCSGAGEFVTSSFSWNPPRRTITINEVEVKAPENVQYHTAHMGEAIVLHFKTTTDADAMKAALEGKQP